MNTTLQDNEIFNKMIENKQISKKDAVDVFRYSKNHTEVLFDYASKLRDAHKRDIVTYSRKSFFNIINLCSDLCSYCTYKAEPNQDKISMMSLQQVKELAQIAKRNRCTEALLVTGERPENKYHLVKEWLNKQGFSSTAEYLVHCSEIILEEGLFPHTNAGNLTRDEMIELKKSNPSLGLMLENSSNRLSESNMPHQFAPSKFPKKRIEVLETAGKLRIPTTTGILLGIGETIQEVIDSIYVIKKIHEKFGTIQEIILQNFQPKEDTKMRDHPTTDQDYFKRIVALTRIIMPKMNIQIPPNLSPKDFHSFLSIGINDWGGISPVTKDWVNPEFPWPKIDNVKRYSSNAGFRLKARFPVYPEFMKMINSRLQEMISEIKDDKGFVKGEFCK